MSPDIDSEKQRLSQNHFLKFINSQPNPAEMVTVYLDDKAEDYDNGIYCALIPNGQVERRINERSWDLHLGGGMPGAVTYHRDGKEQIAYLRFGDDNGVEPLVIGHEFSGMREAYREICEEFRLFHRLYHDRKQDRYIKIDDSGNDCVVAIVEPNRVQIRLLEIRQFLAIKDMHLAVLFDGRQHSTESLDDLGLEQGVIDHRAGLLSYRLGYGDLGELTGHRAFSRLLGKRLISPLPKDKSGFWGFAQREPKKCVEFIIGQHTDGTEITNMSAPDRLADLFGANPGQPDYLTPVHFRKQVLDKYFQQPSKYSVKAGYLKCGGLWGMQMDNGHDDRVVAWLGDLGRDLPYEEQLHWRSHNVPPVGGISKIFYKQQLLAEFVESDRPEHVFKSRYQQLADTCQRKLGWVLLLPLSQEDNHYFEALRVPASDEQKDFDDLVLALTKVLVDSLNEKELMKLIPGTEGADIRGSIARLEKLLMIRGVHGYDQHIKFLRNLQSLRSSGTAHRKGSNYQRLASELDVENRTLQSVFGGILIKAVALLEFLHGVVESGLLGQDTDQGRKTNVT